MNTPIGSTNSSVYLERIQPAIQKIIDCHVAYLNEFLPCFDHDDDNTKAIQSVEKNFKRFYKFFFDNDARVPNEFMEHHGVECFTTSQDVRNVCRPIMLTIVRDLKIPRFTVDPQTSNRLQEYKTCVIDRVISCENKVLTDLWTQMFNILTDEMFLSVILNSEYDLDNPIFDHSSSKHTYIDDRITWFKNMKVYFESQKDKKDNLLKYIDNTINRFESYRDNENEVEL